jgi:hypothetical protein
MVMTKIEGHKFYDQNFGHCRSILSTSNPTWLILRGSHVQPGMVFVTILMVINLHGPIQLIFMAQSILIIELG